MSGLSIENTDLFFEGSKYLAETLANRTQARARTLGRNADYQLRSVLLSSVTSQRECMASYLIKAGDPNGRVSGRSGPVIAEICAEFESCSVPKLEVRALTRDEQLIKIIGEETTAIDGINETEHVDNQKLRFEISFKRWEAVK